MNRSCSASKGLWVCGKGRRGFEWQDGSGCKCIAQASSVRWIHRALSRNSKISQRCCSCARKRPLLFIFGAAYCATCVGTVDGSSASESTAFSSRTPHRSRGSRAPRSPAAIVIHCVWGSLRTWPFGHLAEKVVHGFGRILGVSEGFCSGTE